MTRVRFAEVCRRYGARWIFRSVPFQVSAEERRGGLGRNGEGQTLLLRGLTGEAGDASDEGKV